MDCDNIIRAYSVQRHGSQKVSANFTVKEYACKDGTDTVLICEQLAKAVQAIRDHYGRPFTLLSGYRTPNYNAKVSGSVFSQHCLGTAADIPAAALGTTPEALAAWVEANAEALGIGGIGVYPAKGFVHIDTRKEKARWKG